MEITSTLDFKSIGEKLQTGKDLDDAEKGAVFSVALEYANDLVKNKLGALGGLKGAEKDAILRYEPVAQEVKDYVSGAILGRIVDLHDRAIKAGLTDQDSQNKFAQLGKKLHEKLSINPEAVSDEKLNAFIDELAKEYLNRHFTPEVQANVGVVRGVLSVIVTNNRS